MRRLALSLVALAPLSLGADCNPNGGHGQPPNVPRIADVTQAGPTSALVTFANRCIDDGVGDPNDTCRQFVHYQRHDGTWHDVDAVAGEALLVGLFDGIRYRVLPIHSDGWLSTWGEPVEFSQGDQ